MQLDADKSSVNSGTNPAQEKSIRIKPESQSLAQVSGPKPPKPYQLALQIQTAAESKNADRAPQDRFTSADVEIVQQIGIEGLMLSIVCGRRKPPSHISSEMIDKYREQIDNSTETELLKSPLVLNFGKWLKIFGVKSADINAAVKAIDQHLVGQARSRRVLLPRMPFDWNDAVAAAVNDAAVPIQLRSAAYSLRASNSALLCAINTDPFRSLVVLRKLLAPPKRCATEDYYLKWREAYEKAKVTGLRAKLLALAEAPLLKIARSDAAVGWRLLALEGQDERLKRRAGAELTMLAQKLPRQLLSTMRALDCEKLSSPKTIEALELICNRELLPMRISAFLGNPNHRFTVEEAEVELLTASKWKDAFNTGFLIKTPYPDNYESKFMELARRAPQAVETAVENLLAEVNPETSERLYNLVGAALVLVRQERLKLQS